MHGEIVRMSVIIKISVFYYMTAMYMGAKLNGCEFSLALLQEPPIAQNTIFLKGSKHSHHQESYVLRACSSPVQSFLNVLNFFQ
jgi:hypothetical protein